MTILSRIAKMFGFKTTDHPDTSKFETTVAKNINVVEGSSQVSIVNAQNYHHHAVAEKTTIKLLSGFVQVAEGQVIGRDEQILMLEKAFEQNHAVALVNGMGGIGKTTVALLYLARRQKTYDHLAWIDITDSIENAFLYHTELHDSLGIQEQVNAYLAGKDPQGAFNCIIRSLKALNGKNLLILDNANNRQDLVRNLKSLEKINWHILVTTRDTSASPSDYKTIRIDKLEPSDASKVFELYYKSASDTVLTEEEQGCIAQICRDLDYHTLLLEMVAKAGRANNYTLERLKGVIQEGYINSPALKRRKVSTGISGKKAELSQAQEEAFIAEHLRHIFEHIHWIPLNEEGKPGIKDLLAYHAVLTPDFHTESDLMDYFGISEDEQNGVYSKWQVIAQNGWLQEEKGDVELVYRMHPLLQEMILKQDIIGKITVVAVEPVIDYFTDYFLMSDTKEGHGIFKKEKLDLGKNLIKIFDEETDSNFSILQNNMAVVLKDLGDYGCAKGLLQRALTSDEKNFGHDHPDTAASQSNLALVISDLGDFEGAKGLLQKALASAEKNFGQDHPSIAGSQSNLALVLKDLGDYGCAKGLLQRALTSDEKNFGHDHPDTAASQSNLALVISDLGDFEGAKGLLQKALASAEKNFGQDHPSIAGSQSNLALVLKDLGDYKGAKGLLQKALAFDEKTFGHDHPSTATSQSNLATVLRELEDFEGAKGLIQKALASDEKNFGQDHPSIATRQSNLALILKDLGDYEGAKGLIQKALASDEKNFGQDHPSIATRQSNLATVLKALGDYEGAKGPLQKALEWAEKSFGQDHPDTAASQSNLALVLKDLGDYEGAKALLQKAVASAEKNFGKDHLSTATKQSFLAFVLQALGDYEGAKGLLQKAYTTCKLVLGENHPTTKIVKEWLDSFLNP